MGTAPRLAWTLAYGHVGSHTAGLRAVCPPQRLQAAFSGEEDWSGPGSAAGIEEACRGGGHRAAGCCGEAQQASFRPVLPVAPDGGTACVSAHRLGASARGVPGAASPTESHRAREASPPGTQAPFRFQRPQMSPMAVQAPEVQSCVIFKTFLFIHKAERGREEAGGLPSAHMVLSEAEARDSLGAPSCVTGTKDCSPGPVPPGSLAGSRARAQGVQVSPKASF